MNQIDPLLRPSRAPTPPLPPDAPLEHEGRGDDRDEREGDRRERRDAPEQQVANANLTFGPAFTAAYAAAAARIQTIHSKLGQVINGLSIGVRRPAFITGGGGGGAMPAAPTAINVVIAGTPTVGQTLTGNYEYFDLNGNPEGTSTFKWRRDGVVIAGATAKTYVLVAGDAPHNVAFEVTPVTTVAPLTGSPTLSAPVRVSA